MPQVLGIEEVCNLALSSLGQPPIESISDTDDNRAILCNQLWAGTRDWLLRSRPWSFAIKRVQLSASAVAPAWGFDYAYPLPSDLLRLVSTYPEDMTYTVETQDGAAVLLTDEDEVYISYVSRVEQPGLWDSMFAQWMAAELAFKLAYPLTKSAEMVNAMAKLRADAQLAAAVVDAAEATPSRSVSSSWLDARGSFVEDDDEWEAS